MSWRETLDGLKSKSHTQNSHNTQKSPRGGISAVSAVSAYENSEQISRMLEVLSEACQALPIAPTEVIEALTPQEVRDWSQGQIANETLITFARAMALRLRMDQGKRPTHYTKRATCQHCGPIWLWFSGNVAGCPWCWNRISDKSIPRPCPVSCGACRHFERIQHPHLGNCSKGTPAGLTSLWDTTPRQCDRFIPARRADDPDA